MLRRPIVLASLFAFVETILFLSFPGAFHIIFPCAVLLLALCIFICIIKGRKEFLLVFIPTIVICTLFPYFSFLKYEKASSEFVSKFKDNPQTEYTATVEDCKNYSSYTQFFVNINAADGKTLDYPIKARVGCYSPIYLDKGDTIFFAGTPINVSEIENDTFNTTNYLKGKKIFLDFPACTVSSSLSGKPSLISSLRSYTRKTVYRYVDINMDFETASVCYAMFTGEKDSIPSEIKESCTESGLAPILCV